MKRIILVLGIGISITLSAYAQNNKLQSTFDEWRKELKDEFDDFRRKSMAEYTEFVRHPWKEFGMSAPVPKPKHVPLPPVVKPIKEFPTAPIQLNIDEIIQPLVVDPQPQPLEPIEEMPEVDTYIKCTFFGTEATVRLDKEKKIKLDDTKETSVANALRVLSTENYDNTILDCLKLRKDLQLCDWAYLQLLKSVSESAYAKSSNESVLFMAYLYMQSGYKMRLATDKAKLYMLYASKHHIYDAGYYFIDGDYYFGLGELPSTLTICQVAYPNEKSLSLIIEKEPLFDINPIECTAHSTNDSDNEKNMKANKNMLDFYSSYPTSMVNGNFMTRWAMYANMPMPRNIAEQTYNLFESHIKGLNQLESINYILNWVQTCFVYEYDNKVWGDDRVFFPEETLYYPYCDCEDRSILLTRLVRDLLGLKCILIYYPGHLAAAVKVTEGSPTGDYINIKDERFFIMDGTILSGASLGVSMSGMDNESATVILLE